MNAQPRAHRLLRLIAIARADGSRRLPALVAAWLDLPSWAQFEAVRAMALNASITGYYEVYRDNDDDGGGEPFGRRFRRN